MWRAWIGFNFSHSLGVLLVAGLALCGSREVAYSFGWEAPVVPRRIGISWAANS
jgi:hypothetical protein